MARKGKKSKPEPTTPAVEEPTETKQPANVTCDHSIVGVTKQNPKRHCLKCGKVL